LDEQLPVFRLWAKRDPYKSLAGHMLDVGAVAWELLRDSDFSPLARQLSCWLHCSEDNAVRVAAYLAAMHDCGKCHPSFQMRGASPELHAMLQKVADCSNFPAEGFRHERYTKLVLKRILKRRAVFSGETIARMAEIDALHHQGKRGKTVRELPDAWAGTAAWQSMQNELEKLIWDVLEPAEAEISAPNTDAVCMTLLGITILSDWIASGPFFAEGDLEEKDGTQYFRRTRLRAEEFLKSSGYCESGVTNVVSFSDLWPKIPRESMRPLQQSVETFFKGTPEEKPLAMLLEAPMGEGKTEAGLYAAFRLAEMWGKTGFYIGLPTAATSNQMFGRVNTMLRLHGAEAARLLHASAWLVDQNAEGGEIHTQDEQIARAWTMPLRRGLLAPAAVGTIDQAMMAALSIRYGVLRLTGLQSKVLILDEIHAYDAYMSSIILKLLEWCRALQIPVVMLSATLPSEKKQEILKVYGSDCPEEKAYPAITAAYDGGCARITAVPGTYQKAIVKLRAIPALGQTEQIAKRALRETDSGGCLCVLVNTVKEAQKVYRALKQAAPDSCRLLLFHARFGAARRDELEKTCVSLFGKDKDRRPARAILVATQVAEQSLDLDFDRMITELAPIDLLLQRMGRMHRHRDTKRPESMREPVLEVLVPAADASDDLRRRYGSTGAVYAEILLKKTEELLERKEKMQLPEDIAPAVESVYSGTRLGKEEEAWERYCFDNELSAGSALQYELSGPEPDEFSLAFSDPVFDDEEGDTFLAAKTRAGTDSVRLALVPGELYDQIGRERTISKELAKETLRYGVSVPAGTVKSLLSDQQDNPRFLQGSGLLAGIKIFRAEEDGCKLPDDRKIKLDPEFGFLTEEA
jgi:CRISPR-associated endonuclease/helicase Cas3